jgi:hypothetical protein
MHGYVDSTSAQNFLFWDNRCSSLAQKVYSCPPHSVPIEHMFTITSSTRPRIPEGNDDILSVVYQAILNQVQRIADREAFIVTRVPPEHKDLYDETTDFLLKACSGRDYFSTEGGRVGLGPPGTEKGDVVVVFYGSLVRFVLRARSPVEGWILKGEAYVYGLMDLKETKLMPGPAEDEVFEMF